MLLEKNESSIRHIYQSIFKPSLAFAAVYDGLRETEFAGIKSQQPQSISIPKDVFVFVTANTANKTAKELFERIGKENYFLCQLDFIKNIGEK